MAPLGSTECRISTWSPAATAIIWTTGRARLFVETTAHDIEGFTAIVYLAKDALSLCGEGFVEQVLVTTWNNAVCPFEPRSHGQPSLVWLSEKVCSHGCLLLYIVSTEQILHVLSVDGPIVGDHVHQTCPSIRRLEQCRKVTRFDSNLSNQLNLSFHISTLINCGM